MSVVRLGTNEVGPVLESSELGHQVAALIVESNPGTRVLDLGSYLRVLSPGGCRISRAALETRLGRVFSLPGDLELIMPSFKGKLRLSADEAFWEPF